MTQLVKAGLEQVLEEKLRGKKGGRVFVEDAQGKKLKLGKTDAVDGENVTLTIDSVVQEKRIMK